MDGLHQNCNRPRYVVASSLVMVMMLSLACLPKPTKNRRVPIDTQSDALTEQTVTPGMDVLVVPGSWPFKKLTNPDESNFHPTHHFLAYVDAASIEGLYDDASLADHIVEGWVLMDVAAEVDEFSIDEGEGLSLRSKKNPDHNKIVADKIESLANKSPEYNRGRVGNLENGEDSREHQRATKKDRNQEGNTLVRVWNGIRLGEYKTKDELKKKYRVIKVGRHKQSITVHLQLLNDLERVLKVLSVKLPDGKGETKTIDFQQKLSDLVKDPSEANKLAILTDLIEEIYNALPDETKQPSLLESITIAGQVSQKGREVADKGISERLIQAKKRQAIKQAISDFLVITLTQEASTMAVAPINNQNQSARGWQYNINNLVGKEAQKLTLSLVENESGWSLNAENKTQVEANANLLGSSKRPVKVGEYQLAVSATLNLGDLTVDPSIEEANPVAGAFHYLDDKWQTTYQLDPIDSARARAPGSFSVRDRSRTFFGGFFTTIALEGRRPGRGLTPGARGNHRFEALLARVSTRQSRARVVRRGNGPATRPSFVAARRGLRGLWIRQEP